MINEAEIYFAVVDGETGALSHRGGCPIDALGLQAGEGQQVVAIGSDQDVSNHYWRFDAGVWAEYPPSPGPWATFDYAAGAWIDPRTADDLAAELEAARAAGIGAVNQISGEVRSRFITVIPGQEMLYMQKEQEAKDWLAADASDIADYPLIAAEVGITAPGPDEVAQVYVNMAHMLRLTAAQLETLRLGTVLAIEGATDPAVIEAALAQFMAALA